MRRSASRETGFPRPPGSASARSWTLRRTRASPGLTRAIGDECRMSTEAHAPAGLPRDWLPEAARQREREILDAAADKGLSWFDARVAALTERNKEIHERECINLNPATNVMNPRAEAAMSAGLGSRPSLGYPGDKYEMGLEAIEEIEVLAAALACRVFASTYAEIRVGSGALANAYAFLATCAPGDSIIVPPASIGGQAPPEPPGARQ